MVFLSFKAPVFSIGNSIKVFGNISVRSFYSNTFEKAKTSINFNESLLLKSHVSYSNKLATDSKLIISSFTITLFPGSLIKIDKKSIRPMLGRIKITKEIANKDFLIFKTKKFLCEFTSGILLIEACPNGDFYIAAPKSIKSILKENNRKIHILQAGNEIFFPAFGTPKIRGMLSNRWSNPPAGYANVDPVDLPIIKTKSGKKNIASNTVETDIEEVASSTTNTISIEQQASPTIDLKNAEIKVSSSTHVISNN